MQREHPLQGEGKVHTAEEDQDQVPGVTAVEVTEEDTKVEDSRVEVLQVVEAGGT